MVRTASMNTRRFSHTEADRRYEDKDAADAGINDGARIDDEQERVRVVGILVLVAAVGLGVRDALAQVLDDARAPADALRGEHAEPVQRRCAYLDERCCGFGGPAHTATGARIGA